MAQPPGIVISDDDDVLSEADEQLDEEMSEAERRINLAGYYKQLARGGVFKDGSEEAAIVDGELKEFARERMSILLNLGTHKPKVELPFTADQVEMLKALADRYAQKQASPSQPTVRPLASPSAPAAPVATRPAIPQVKPLAPPANARKPAQAVQKPVAKKPAQQAVPKGKPRAGRDYDDISDGEVFTERGKQYRFVPHPDSSIGGRLKVHVTPGPVRNPQAIAMPIDMAQESHRSAENNINANPALKNQRIVTAVAMTAAGVNEIGGK